MSLAEFVAFAPLTSLLKPDGGIWPIFVDSIWRRLISKVSMKGIGKDVHDISITSTLGLGYWVVLRPFCIVSIGC